MMHSEVEKIITQYAADVLPVFADRFERWPVGPSAIKVQAALALAEKRYRSFGCDAEANTCYQACVEIELRAKIIKNGAR